MRHRITERVLLVAAGIVAAGQMPAQSPPAFAVASVKPSKPEDRGIGVQFLPGGRLVISNLPLQIIVATARWHDCPLLTVDERIVSYPHVRTLK